LRGSHINTLTVIATEKYEEFAENLQIEIEKDTGIKFGIVEKHQFAAIQIQGKDGKLTALGFHTSQKIWGNSHFSRLLG
jgi:type III restriction enzyme